MAFSCLHENTEIKSFTYSPADWGKLADRFDGMRMTMPCCDQPASMFSDELGGQYFIHSEPIAADNTTCMESSSEYQEELYAKFIISKTLHNMGWEVTAEPMVTNGAKNELLTGIYANKGSNKNVVEVMGSRAKMLDIRKKHQAHKLAGLKSVWFDITNLSRRENRYGVYPDKDLLLFDMLLTKGNVFRVFDIYIPRNKDAFYSKDPREISLTVEDFFDQMISRRLGFLTRDDGNHYLSVGLGKKACYKCDMTITTVKRVFYHEHVYGEWRDESIIGHSVREIPRTDIAVINEHFAKQYGFNPLKDVYSKTEGGEYMANSCKYCGGLVGKFFEDEEFYDMKCRNWEVVSDRVVSTKVHRGLMENEPGRWMLNIDPDAPVSYLLSGDESYDADETAFDDLSAEYIDDDLNDDEMGFKYGDADIAGINEEPAPSETEDAPADVLSFWIRTLGMRIDGGAEGEPKQ